MKCRLETCVNESSGNENGLCFMHSFVLGVLKRSEERRINPSRVIVCGGRRFFDKGFIEHILSEYNISELAHGGASGVDTIAGNWAKRNSIPVVAFNAEWGVHGRNAGMIRNERMLSEFKPDYVIAFIIRSGPGTRGMVNISLKKGLDVEHISHTSYDKYVNCVLGG